MRIIAEGTLIALRTSARSYHSMLHPILHASERLGTLRVGDRSLRTDVHDKSHCISKDRSCRHDAPLMSKRCIASDHRAIPLRGSCGLVLHDAM
jgi:hypothetical protein